VTIRKTRITDGILSISKILLPQILLTKIFAYNLQTTNFIMKLSVNKFTDE